MCAISASSPSGRVSQNILRVELDTYKEKICQTHRNRKGNGYALYHLDTSSMGDKFSTWQLKKAKTGKTYLFFSFIFFIFLMYLLTLSIRSIYGDIFCKDH
jgi:hypothetical protein